MTGGGAMPTLRMTHIHRKRFHGFLEVAITGAETIAQIRTLIAAKTGLRVSHISYRGNYLSKSLRLAHLLPEFMSNSTAEDEPPRFAVHTKTLAGKELVVRTLTGKLLVIFLPLNTSTVKDLKEEIRDLEDIPLDQLRLLFTGKLLEDDKKLSDYKIGQHSIIDQIEPAKTMDSGLYVSDNVDHEEELSCGVKVDFLDFGSDWRVAAPGLNVEGLCQNTECVAYAKMVICNKGFSVFNFALMEGTCPMCKHSFDALTCAFTSCVWMYEGRAKTIAPVRVRDLRSTWIEAGNRYELFHSQEAGHHSQAEQAVQAKCRVLNLLRRVSHDQPVQLAVHSSCRTIPCRRGGGLHAPVSLGMCHSVEVAWRDLLPYLPRLHCMNPRFHRPAKKCVILHTTLDRLLGL
jgi:hypothetical protein